MSEVGTVQSFSDYLGQLSRSIKRQYDRNVNIDLSQQRPHELLSRNVRAVLWQGYQQLQQQAVEADWELTTDSLEAVSTIQDQLMEYALQKHRSSCAISNFPDEHNPSSEYVAQTLHAVQQDWQAFAARLLGVNSSNL